MSVRYDSNCSKECNSHLNLYRKLRPVITKCDCIITVIFIIQGMFLKRQFGKRIRLRVKMIMRMMRMMLVLMLMSVKWMRWMSRFDWRNIVVVVFGHVFDQYYVIVVWNLLHIGHWIPQKRSRDILTESGSHECIKVAYYHGFISKLFGIITWYQKAVLAHQ